MSLSFIPSTLRKRTRKCSSNSSLSFFLPTSSIHSFSTSSTSPNTTTTSTTTDIKQQPGPLTGVKILELGQFVAGPMATMILGYFGAEVIKIEPLTSNNTGDQLRQFRDVDSTQTSWWWYSLGRNKKSIVVDLRKPQGQEIALSLATKWADVLVENFRPGTLDKWGLGATTLQEKNPQLIYTAISGYGQTGPYKSRAGFASACEAMGGFRYVNGFPDRPSVRPNLSMGDTLAGMNAAMGTLLALYARDGNKTLNNNNNNNKRVGGQIVDQAIYEAVYNVMEGVVCDYSGAGIIRQPSGSTVTGIVPTNTYRTKDGKSIVIGANGDALFKRLMHKIGRSELADDVRFKDNQSRVQHSQLLDQVIEEWTLTKTAEEATKLVDEADVPNGKIYSVVDMIHDPQYIAREQFERVKIPSLPPDRDLLIPAFGPKLTKTPGKTKWPGPQLGQHTREVLGEVLKYSKEEIDGLERNGVVG
jgi:crotonobetainyl-CoA:carnitine CoA-transferase CaiB-like acyl-CoA transferase